MFEITSFEIGDLFEKASQQMLLILFESWGYNIQTLETRRQKSGTQHGFDIYLKVYTPNYLPINVFIECKGSKDFGTIDRYELAIKSDQLKRSAFAVKDVHLFFSPTLTINYKNDETPIEDDFNPFCVVDMMKRNGETNDVFDLFMAYDGNNVEIENYCKNILKLIPRDHSPSRNFEEIVSKLKTKFLTRIEAFLSIPMRKDVVLLTPSLWNNIKTKSQTDRLQDYYLRLDSSKSRLFDVIANDFHISNQKAKQSLLYHVKEIQKQNGGLIKILSNGGEGKSTFLLDIGRELCKEYPVFNIYEWDDSTLENIKIKLNLLKTDLMPIVLLDDAAHFENQFENFGEIIANWPGGIVFILGERFYRYQRMQNREAFENLFQFEPKQFNFQSKSNASGIFERFFDQLRIKFINLTNEDRENSRSQFLLEGKRTIAEKIFEVLRKLHQNKRIVFPFDWDEWNEIHKNSSLRHVYLMVSAFYQFGNSITIEFCTKFDALKYISALDIRNAIDNTINQPIVRNGDFLQLRHEKVAEWFIDDERQHENVRALYQEWLSKINDPFSKDLLLWTYRNYDFIKCDYLKSLLPLDLVLKTLYGFIAEHPNELAARTEAAKVLIKFKKLVEAETILKDLLILDKENLPARTELSKIYQQQKKWSEAEAILKEEIAIAPDALHPRTELSKIYQQQKKWSEAEAILKEEIAIAPDALHPRTELSKIYQQQKKWSEAEAILNEALEIAPDELHPRTELSKIYQQQKKWSEAEAILKEEIAIAPDALHPRTELSKIYQQQKKWSEAEAILKEYIELDPEGLHPRTELSKIYQQQKKWSEAEAILKEEIAIAPDALHPRTELSKIYQQQKKWSEAEAILNEALEIAPDELHPRTELSKIYQQQKKWSEAEAILKEYIELDPEGLHPRTELSKIYQQQKKWSEAEAILKDLLILDKDNFRALTEMALLYKKWMRDANIDFLNKKELNKKYRQAVFESYKINRFNASILMELADIFRIQRQYRGSLAFLKIVENLDSSDLESVRVMEILYGYMNDNVNVQEMRKRGLAFIEQSPFVKFRERFEKQIIPTKLDTEPISLKETGHYIVNQNEKYILTATGKNLTICHGANICNSLKNGDAVYYGLYLINGSKRADCIEPIFDAANDLSINGQVLKDLFLV